MPDDLVREKMRRLHTAFVVTVILLLLTVGVVGLLITDWGPPLGWNITFVILLAFLVWGILVDIVYWWYRRDRKKP